MIRFKFCCTVQVAYEIIGEGRPILEAAARRGFQHVPGPILDNVLDDMHSHGKSFSKPKKVMTIVKGFRDQWGCQRGTDFMTVISCLYGRISCQIVYRYRESAALAARLHWLLVAISGWSDVDVARVMVQTLPEYKAKRRRSAPQDAGDDNVLDDLISPELLSAVSAEMSAEPLDPASAVSAPEGNDDLIESLARCRAGDIGLGIHWGSTSHQDTSQNTRTVVHE